MSFGPRKIDSRWIPFLLGPLLILTPSLGIAETKSVPIVPASNLWAKKDRPKTNSDDQGEKSKPTKPKAPIAKVPAESRSGKILELVGGGAYMDGYAGITGQSGLMIGPNLVMEAGLFLGRKGNNSSYLDGFAQGKIYVGDFFFVSLGGSVGRVVTTHEEKLDPGSDTWKESGTKLRVFVGIGPQLTFGVLTMGLQASGGYGLLMGEVENDLPESNQAAVDEAKDKVTIASGLSYSASVFVGLAL